VSHIGYGNDKAALWFLGMEEHLDGERDEELRWRLENLTHPIDTFAHLRDSTIPSTHTWRYMARIARRLLEKAVDWDDAEKARDYIARDQLGSASGETFLLELLPLPEVGRNIFSYSDFYPEGPVAYRQHVLPSRIAWIRSHAQAARDTGGRVVFAYGREFWPAYESIWPTSTWTETELKLTGRPAVVKIGVDRGTLIVLTPFFSARALPILGLKALLDLIETLQPSLVHNHRAWKFSP
jgi:hypothetical protein